MRISLQMLLMAVIATPYSTPFALICGEIGVVRLLWELYMEVD